MNFSASSGFILGIDLSGNPLPAGEGLLLTVTYTPSPELIEACILNALFGSPDGLELSIDVGECQLIDPCDHDCANICSGTAFEDTCGVCSGGTTDHIADSDIDCNGICFGEALIDDCGVCSEGDTGIEFNSDKIVLENVMEMQKF